MCVHALVVLRKSTAEHTCGADVHSRAHHTHKTHGQRLWVLLYVLRTRGCRFKSGISSSFQSPHAHIQVCSPKLTYQAITSLSALLEKIHSDGGNIVASIQLFDHSYKAIRLPLSESCLDVDICVKSETRIALATQLRRRRGSQVCQIGRSRKRES